MLLSWFNSNAFPPRLHVRITWKVFLKQGYLCLPCTGYDSADMGWGLGLDIFRVPRVII